VLEECPGDPFPAQFRRNREIENLAFVGRHFAGHDESPDAIFDDCYLKLLI
jgi:hypothetical protein